VETDRAGRVRIQPDLTVPGHPEIFVAGDTAALNQDGKPLAGVAQVAMQQGRYAGRLIHRRVTDKSEPRPFRYVDKGMMAVVGQGYAVLQSGTVHIKGAPAWLAWRRCTFCFWVRRASGSIPAAPYTRAGPNDPAVTIALTL